MSNLSPKSHGFYSLLVLPRTQIGVQHVQPLSHIPTRISFPQSTSSETTLDRSNTSHSPGPNLLGFPGPASNCSSQQTALNTSNEPSVVPQWGDDLGPNGHDPGLAHFAHGGGGQKGIRGARGSAGG